MQRLPEEMSIDSMVAAAMTESEGEIEVRTDISQEELDALMTIPQELKDKIAAREETLRRIKEETSKISFGNFLP